MFAERHPVYLTFLLLGAANSTHGLNLTADKARDRLKKLLPDTDVDKILDAKGDPDLLANEMLEAERVYLREELALERGESGVLPEADESPNADFNDRLRNGAKRGVDVDLSGGDMEASIRAALGRGQSEDS